jgi:hypothetical protein
MKKYYSAGLRSPLKKLALPSPASEKASPVIVSSLFDCVVASIHSTLAGGVCQVRLLQKDLALVIFRSTQIKPLPKIDSFLLHFHIVCRNAMKA